MAEPEVTLRFVLENGAPFVAVSSLTDAIMVCANKWPEGKPALVALGASIMEQAIKVLDVADPYPKSVQTAPSREPRTFRKRATRAQ